MWRTWCHGVVATVCAAVVVVSVRGFASSPPPVMGDYKLECNDIRNCDEDSSAYKITKYNQDTNSSGATNCSGEMHLSRGLDDKTSGTYTLKMMVDKKWQVVMSQNFTKGCGMISSTLPELFTLLQLPGCPVANGTYYFKPDDFAGTKLSQFPMLPYGRFRLVVKISRVSEADTGGCLLFDLNVAPK